jgi:hypothetical protein
MSVAEVRPDTPRPFDHARHERLSCGACHGAGELHRTLTVRTARDCAACHHDPRRGGACAVCHAAPARAEARGVSAPLSLTVWEAPRTRTLPFNHRVHGNLACGGCHGTPVTLEVDRKCGSCHLEHHRPEADCAACHPAPAPAAHPAEAHLGCGGSGCHAPEVAPSPTLSRSLCLTCHLGQRAHEPGRACAACHEIPGAARSMHAGPARAPGGAP